MDRLEARVRKMDRDLLMGVAIRSFREIRRMYAGEVPFNLDRRMSLDRIANLAVSEWTRPGIEAVRRTQENRARIKIVK